MANVPWNAQGTPTLSLASAGQAFFGITAAAGQTTAMSNLYSFNGAFWNPDFPSQSTAGTRGMSGLQNRSFVYIYGQGGTFGSPNGYTNIYINQAQGNFAQTVNLQTNQGARCWIRNRTQISGAGGAGGQGGQGGPGQAGFGGAAAFNIQGYSGDFRLNSQGYYVVGGGGGGSGGNQGSAPNQSRYDSQYSPSGGGGGGGGGGFGAGGNTPDARHQGQAGQAGGYYNLGYGGGGGPRAGGGAPGGNSGNYGGNAAHPGGAPGQTISGPYNAVQVTY